VHHFAVSKESKHFHPRPVCDPFLFGVEAAIP